MEKIYRIAIDGPSGAGKSTIARAVASELNIDYIDTGAMYRAIGYKMHRDSVSPEDSEAVRGMLENTDIDFVQGKILLDGDDVGDRIRTPEMSRMASRCSALPEVRAKLVEIQRSMASRKSVVMDGRDIGTNVLRDAEIKIYLTASAEERATRRFRELQGRGEEQSYEDVLADIRQRDHQDMTRELNPLKKAEDAVELDTTGMGVEEVVERVRALIDAQG